ncbi:MAG: non-canonical purine NTP pyrophosphatase [Bacilli bacterium]|nr:non-canonical purine NTP pyrophosphatase [Bacilli bacterium]
MKQVLFATHNPSKLMIYKNMLKNIDVELICLNDLKINYEVNEEGNSSEEIAIKKVAEYSKLTNLITISEDTGLYFDGVEKEEQPGINVNFINGKKMSEEERITYYLKLINKYGGKLNGFWLKTVAVSDMNGNISTFNYKIMKEFVNKLNAKRNPGYPLDSISITPEFKKYTVDLTDEENIKLNNMCNKDICEFLKAILS